ncbi:unnamed protein product [Caenorhabditis bovis]|uniref:Uncharacterized protein n=1 Tax=Caenorhabditis bovis TaxID=2654633 RepID=A0A8S1FE24_9PELO|nr:unnamed protein product [Caenorhabditis bovis]
MKHLFLFIQFILAIILIINPSHSLPVSSQGPPQLGSIHGSPVVAIIHGNSDTLKEDLQTKDTEADPLEKFGKIVD